LSWIQNSVRIERLLEPTMKVTCDIARGVGPPAFFRQTDSVFACDYTAPGQDFRKKIVERALDFVTHGRIAIVSVRHDVDVNITVSGMAETSDRESMFCLQPLGEFHQIDEATAWDDDVFVQFRQAGCAQRVTELTAQRPELFAIGFARGYLKRIWPSLLNQFVNRRRLAADALLLSIQINK